MTGRHGDGDQHLQQSCGRGGVEQTRARVDRTEPHTSAHRARHGGRRAGDRSYVSVEIRAGAASDQVR
jgi:hypothetical protein